MEQLDLEVAEAIKNAKENGYDMIADKWTSDAIASDMVECGGISEDYSFEDIVDAIDRFRNK